MNETTIQQMSYRVFLPSGIEINRKHLLRQLFSNQLVTIVRVRESKEIERATHKCIESVAFAVVSGEWIKLIKSIYPRSRL